METGIESFQFIIKENVYGVLVTNRYSIFSYLIFYYQCGINSDYINTCKIGLN